MRLLLFCFVLFAQLAICQTPLFWHYSEADGLPSNTVYAAMQDSDGYLWFATSKGVSRYNGKTFTNFSTSDGLTDNEVFQIKEDASGRIWFLTYSGIPCYYESGEFHNPGNEQMLADAPIGGFLRSFTEGPDGSIYLGSQRGLVYKITKENALETVVPENVNVPLIRYLWSYNNQVFGVKDNIAVINFSTGSTIDLNRIKINDHAQRYLFSNARLFMSYKNILTIFSSNFESKQKVTLPSNEFIQGISSGFDEAHLAICTKNGLRFFEFGSNTLSKPHLAGHSISSTCYDDQGGLWITSLNNGVYYAPYSGLVHYELKIKGEPLPVHSLFCKDQTLFFGASDYRFGFLSNDSLEHFQLQVDEHNGQGRVMDFFDLGSTVALRAEKTIYYGKRFSEQLSAINLPGITVTTENPETFWMGTLSDLSLLDMKKPDGLPALKNYPVGSRVFCMLKEPDSAFLVGTADGVKRVLLKSNSIQTVFPETALKRISGMKRLDGNQVLVTTKGWGAFVYQNDVLVAHYDHTSGLVSSDISRIRLDSNDGLWLCTAKGISYLQNRSQPTSEWKWNNISANNGLPVSIVEDVAVVDERLFIASSIGIVSMDIPNFLSPKVPPRLIVNGLGNASERIKPSTEILEIPDDWKAVTIHYEAITYPSKMLWYRFRLDGEGWQETGSEDLSLANLQPGEHLIELSVKSERSDWSQPITVQLEVPTGIWQTWWVLLLEILAVSAFMAMLFRLKIILVDRQLLMRYLRDLIEKAAERNTITVKVGTEKVKIQIRDILWIKSEANYCSIVTTKNKHFVLASLRSFEDSLAREKRFLRVHRGYIINIKKVTASKRNQVTIEDTHIPIGATYINAFRAAYPDFQG